MTGEKLRAIAHWLDVYDELGESYIRLVELYHHPMPDVLEQSLKTVRSDEVQVDLRRWADQIDVHAG
jgi:hypothetical protein